MGLAETMTLRGSVMLPNSCTTSLRHGSEKITTFCPPIATQVRSPASTANGHSCTDPALLMAISG